MAEPEEDEAPGVPEWVVTYGDMMSLLLTFFIMLVSMSELKEEGSIRVMLDAIRESFGAMDGRAGAPGKSTQTMSSRGERHSAGARKEGGMEKFSRKSPGRAGPHHTVERVNHGTMVTLGGPVLFPSQNAELTPELKKNLDVLIRTLGDKPNLLVVKGHTSPEPLPKNSPFGDHMALSFARAEAVMTYLVEHGIDPERIQLTAAGASELRTRTRRTEAQALNRRVDVFISDSYISPAKPSSSEDR